MPPYSEPACDVNITPPFLRVSFKIVELKGLWKHIFRLGVKLYKQSCFRAKVSGINILYSGNRFYYSLCFHFYCGLACGVADGKSITSTGSQVLEVKSWFNSRESKYILLRKGRNSIFFDKDRVSFKQVIFCLNQLHFAETIVISD